MPGIHAILSPSASHRWLNCTAAPRLEACEADRGSDYAAEGTLAHAYCARQLKQHLGLDTSEEDREILSLKDRYYSDEMRGHVEAYCMLVFEKLAAARAKTPDARLLVETRLDFSEYIPESFGTADAIIIADDCMEVIDFKYGKGVEVSADHNPQMMIYALGALEEFGYEYDIRRVRMTIVQPRLGNISEFEMRVSSLLAWADETLRPKAHEAWAGGKTEPGDWCRFCKVKSKCKALARMALDTVGDAPDPSHIDPRMLEEEILPRLDTIRNWIGCVEEYALQQALAGVELKGWKVVEGRSVRTITDKDAVINALKEAEYLPDAYLKPRELRSLTDLEKLMGKKRFNELCGAWVHKPAGKPTLAPDTDKRPEYNSATADFKDIEL